MASSGNFQALAVKLAATKGPNVQKGYSRAGRPNSTLAQQEGRKGRYIPPGGTYRGPPSGGYRSPFGAVGGLGNASPGRPRVTSQRPRAYRGGAFGDTPPTRRV